MDLENRVAFAKTKRDLILHTADVAEGVRAFAEKGAPIWTGK